MREVRTPSNEADPAHRCVDFRPVDEGYDRPLALEEAGRCLQCARPLCSEACPVSVDIRGFIGKITEGEEEEGLRIILERNLFPAICGRVCPQEKQCESACILGRKYEPVAIGRLERYLGDKSGEFGIDLEKAQSSGKRVAVLGSGPAGLSCAGELARLGHDVTVYEAFHLPGGVLSYGIPEFRLPKKVLGREVENLIDLGVKIETNMVAGRIFTAAELFEEGFDAVFIGIGAGLPTFMDIPGEHLNGVFASNEFLTRVNLMHAYDSAADTPVHRGQRVAVIGGGNVAMDAARTALRLGAQTVSLVYRRTVNEMPARAEEIEHAKEEGVLIRTLCAPLEIEGSAEGFVTGLRCQDMELSEPGEDGRRRPVIIPGSETLIPCDTAILAVGTRTNRLLDLIVPGVRKNERGYLVTDENGATSLPGVWAGGDIVTGAATVILAMGAGKKAAESIDAWLKA